MIFLDGTINPVPSTLSSKFGVVSAGHLTYYKYFVEHSFDWDNLSVRDGKSTNVAIKMEQRNHGIIHYCLPCFVDV